MFYLHPLLLVLQVIRPGHFVSGPIRDNGLKQPLLIKGDRYNFNPQMGVALLDTGLTAAELEERMDTEKEVGVLACNRCRVVFSQIAVPLC